MNLIMLVLFNGSLCSATSYILLFLLKNCDVVFIENNSSRDEGGNMFNEDVEDRETLANSLNVKV